ncbi:MAG: hypothetical protein IT361_06335 [Gemmatimonadaceae bacterium]|nr:hypothetical protein [Gemmatimonadaceae bacterium]
MPHGYELRGDSGRKYAPRGGMDLEYRYGVDEAMDVGVRMPSLSGLIVNMKRRQFDEQSSIWRAYTLGGGVVNGGNHLYGELILHVSASELVPKAITPYGALRMSQVVPLRRGAVSDWPTIGVAFGAKVGNEEYAFMPEVGVFHDRSALGINSRRIIVVPSLSISRRQTRARRD